MGPLLSEIEQMVTPILESENVELVDLSFLKEHGGWVLRFYLDKPGGITPGDCGEWGDRLGKVLDEKDPIKHAYTLEVSSPGVYRTLKKIGDFIRFSGERVHVKLWNPINGQKNFHGKLLGADEMNVRMQLEDGREALLPRDRVAHAKLDPQIDF